MRFFDHKLVLLAFAFAFCAPNLAQAKPYRYCERLMIEKTVEAKIFSNLYWSPGSKQKIFDELNALALTAITTPEAIDLIGRLFEREATSDEFVKVLTLSPYFQSQTKSSFNGITWSAKIERLLKDLHGSLQKQKFWTYGDIYELIGKEAQSYASLDAGGHFIGTRNLLETFLTVNLNPSLKALIFDVSGRIVPPSLPWLYDVQWINWITPSLSHVGRGGDPFDVAFARAVHRRTLALLGNRLSDFSDIAYIRSIIEDLHQIGHSPGRQRTSVSRLLLNQFTSDLKYSEFFLNLGIIDFESKAAQTILEYPGELGNLLGYAQRFEAVDVFGGAFWEVQSIKELSHALVLLAQTKAEWSDIERNFSSKHFHHNAFMKQHWHLIADAYQALLNQTRLIASNDRATWHAKEAELESLVGGFFQR